MDDDIVLAMKYTLRGAQEAVYGLLRLKKKSTKVYRADFMLRKALKSLLEDDSNRTESNGDLRSVSFSAS
jgi:myosin-crossreactive antigen